MSYRYIRRILEYTKGYIDVKYQSVSKLTDLPFTIPKNYIGRGSQSKVYKHPSELNTVIKIVDVNKVHNLDEYESMISLFINDRNPFFPIIYEVYEIRDEDKLVIVMEKLHRLNIKKMSITHKQYFLNVLGISRDQIIADYVEESLPNASPEQKEEFEEELKHITKGSHLNKIIDFFINQLFEGNVWLENVKHYSDNPEFVKAAHKINKFKGSLDLKSDNLMFRLTGVGPQLVFSDPVS